ncbi:MAG TPA: hypothetical protein VFM98_19725 [Ramlibacter sp.]|uniref:hypothetical protein n=1 Tax=Ramlibacter sp. TaxID=1917967 RepID=UPI002D806A03|nr:hypothetical protein [Ramlibacter sp.]HET8747839.1 hypothetical protein [Ramlibacter sp.]
MSHSCMRLLCASQWSRHGSAVEELLRLRPALLQRGQPRGLRSVLLSTHRWIVQWHEGPEPLVMAECRHLRTQLGLHSPRLLHGSRGPRVLREPVQVASLHTQDKAADVAHRIEFLAGEEADGWPAELLDVWQAVAAPCQAASEPGFVARRQVVALVSNANGAVDLLRALAQQLGVRVAYQRHAGSDLQRSDAGAAYIDVPRGSGGLVRVQAFSRRALAPGLELLGLRHVERLVVVLGDQGTRKQALVDEVAGVLAGLQPLPSVHVVSACLSTRAWAAGVLREVPGLAVSQFDAPSGAVAALAPVLVPA